MLAPLFATLSAVSFGVAAHVSGMSGSGSVLIGVGVLCALGAICTNINELKN